MINDVYCISACLTRSIISESFNVFSMLIEIAQFIFPMQ